MSKMKAKHELAIDKAFDRGEHRSGQKVLLEKLQRREFLKRFVDEFIDIDGEIMNAFEEFISDPIYVGDYCIEVNESFGESELKVTVREYGLKQKVVDDFVRDINANDINGNKEDTRSLDDN